MGNDPYYNNHKSPKTTSWIWCVSSSSMLILNSLITWARGLYHLFLIFELITWLVMGIQSLSSIGLLWDRTEIIIKSTVIISTRAGWRTTLSLSHWRSSFLCCFMHNLNMVDIIYEIRIDLHFIPMLIDIRCLSWLILNIHLIILVHLFIIFICYFQMAFAVTHCFNGYSWRLFIFISLLVKRCLELGRIRERNSFCTKPTVVTIVVVARIYFLQVKLRLVLRFVLHPLEWLTRISVFAVSWRLISLIIFLTISSGPFSCLFVSCSTIVIGISQERITIGKPSVSTCNRLTSIRSSPRCFSYPLPFWTQHRTLKTLFLILIITLKRVPSILNSTLSSNFRYIIFYSCGTYICVVSRF